MSSSRESRPPLVVSASMGYGHLRCAHSLADELGVEVLRADAPPLAAPDEVRVWDRARRLYEVTSRLSQVPVLGAPMRRLLDAATSISHLHPRRDQSRPTRPVRVLDRLIARGLGGNLVEMLRDTGAPLVTTFYAPAIAADRAGCERVFCIVTDVDIHRIWAPFDPSGTRIRYLAPSDRALSRLRAYGVPRERIELTGFPLPPELVGEGDAPDVLERNLAARIVRLDPKGVFRRRWRHDLPAFVRDAGDGDHPPHVVFAVGGAGAQISIARRILSGARDALHAGRLRLTLVAGTRGEVRDRLLDRVHDAGLSDRVGHGVDVLHRDSFLDYDRAFNGLLAGADILWTKPSELVFYGALGLPLVLSGPVGVQERYNRRWAIERGAGLEQRDPRFSAAWLMEWLGDGVLAGAAWSGYRRMPAHGGRRVKDAVLSWI